MPNWENKLTYSDREILRRINDYPDHLHNPIVDALEDGRIAEIIYLFEDLNNKDFTIKGLSRLATLCQMIIMDEQGGPDFDYEPKALRRHWYSWYKVDFAQPFSQLLNQDIQSRDWGTRWAGYLSQTYAGLVDNEDVTYKDLWVKDASRMMESFWQELFTNSNIIVCVEKDSLFEDFIAPAKALGAKAVYSGKGKSSKAAIEKLLREAFGWSEWHNPFTNYPLYVLYISDFDYDGEEVIGPTFAEQCRRYTWNVHEARIGVNPIHVQEHGYSLQEKGYEIKMNHGSSKKWAVDKAIKVMQCVSCEKSYLSQNIDGHCNSCGGSLVWMSTNQTPFLDVKSMKGAYPALGYEIESMRTREYYQLMAESLLRIMPLDEIIEGLRDDCTAELDLATEQIAREVCDQHPGYQELQEQLIELQNRMEGFRREVENWFYQEGEGHEADWRDDNDDPEEQEFIDHVIEASQYVEPWRPFNRNDRTQSMIDWFRDEFDYQINEFLNQEIE